MITGTIKNQVDKIWETCWTGGMSNPLTVVEQLTYLIFIKRLDDQELLKEKKASSCGQPVEHPLFRPNQAHLRWSNFKAIEQAERMHSVVSQNVFPFIKELHGHTPDSAYGQHMRTAVFGIDLPATLKNVVNQLDALPLEDRDTMGDLYEFMLSKLTTAGRNGQFRTPRHIIKMMVELMDPTQEDTLCDPACGTAGFLVVASDYIREKYSNHMDDDEFKNHFNHSMFTGFDFDSTMLRIGSMNLLLHAIENPSIESRDSLSEDHADVEERFSLVLANPPFKGSLDYQSTAKNLGQVAKTKKTELLFVMQIVRSLKLGGRAAIIVPDGVLFGCSKAHVAIRQELIDNHKLDGIVSMPSGVFKPYAGVSTSVLLFTKTGMGGTDPIWFYDMESDGRTLDDKRSVIGDGTGDIPDIIKQWQQRDPTLQTDRKTKSFFVPIDEIRHNKYDLSINRYKEPVYEEREYPLPTTILREIRLLEDEIQSDLHLLEEMLA